MSGADRMIPRSRRFTLDGAAVDIDDFIEVNGFAMPDIEQIASIKVGESITYGGGAAAEFILRRTR